MKKIALLLTLSLIFLTGSKLNAETYDMSDLVEGDFIFQEVDEDSYVVACYAGTSAHVNFPATFKGKKVIGCFPYQSNYNTSSSTDYQGNVTTTHETTTHTCNGTNIDGVLFLHPSNIKSVSFPEGYLFLVMDGFWNNDSFGALLVSAMFNPSTDNPTASVNDFVVLSLVEGVFGEPLTENILGPDLTEMEIPNSMRSIDPRFLANIKTLKNFKVKKNGPFHCENGCLIYKAMLLACPSAQGDFEIPKGVKKIRKAAFANTDITSLTVPEGVTQIDNGAFGGCKALTSVKLPDSLTRIGNFAFDKCPALKSISFPESITEIGNGAFANCKALEPVALPEGLTRIAEITFKNCAALKSVKIPDSVTSIGDSAFENCTSLEKADIPDSVTSIGNSAFANCTSLQAAAIPKDVTTIGSAAFSGCSALKSATFPKNSSGIGSAVFKDCTSLESVTLPEGFSQISADLFSGCTTLKKVVIPASVTQIADNAFENCSNLTIHTPGFSWAFEYGLAHQIKIVRGKNLIESEDNFDIDSNGTVTAYHGNRRALNIPATIKGVEVRKIDLESSDIRDELLWVKIPEGTLDIGYCCFEGCSKLKRVELPKTLKFIDAGAFWYCSSMKEVNIPEGVTHMGNTSGAGDHWTVFYRCPSLTKVHLPGTLEDIHWEELFNGAQTTIYAPKGSLAEEFAHKHNLPFVAEGVMPAPKDVIPAGTNPADLVEEMDASRFEYEEILGGIEITKYTGKPVESLKIPAKINGQPVIQIGERAFHYTKGIKFISIPDGVKVIKRDAFSQCEDLTFVTIPDSVEEIEIRAFWQCTLLRRVTIPKGVTIVSGGAFMECSSLRSVTFHKDVKEIHGGAFGNCKSLTNVVLPEGLTVYYNAFAGSSISTLDIPNSVESLPDRAFTESPLLRTVYIPPHLKDAKDIKDILEYQQAYRTGRVYSYWTINELTFVVKSGSQSAPAADPVEEGDIHIYKSPDGEYWYAIKNNEVEILVFFGTNYGYYANSPTILFVPAEIKGLPVTSIGDGAFQRPGTDCTIHLPPTIRRIGVAAFGHDVEKVNIPDGVQTIGSRAFNNSYLSIRIPESITRLEDWTFEDAAEVIIPKSVTSIGKSALHHAGIIYTSPGSAADIYAKNRTNVKECSMNEFKITYVGDGPVDDQVHECLYPRCRANYVGDPSHAYKYVNANEVEIVKVYGSGELIPEYLDGKRVVALGDRIFAEIRYIPDSVFIPESVQSFGKSTFLGCPKDFTIYTMKGSAAEKYAKENGINCVAH